MASAGFEPTIPERERSQTHALDRATTGIGLQLPLQVLKFLRVPYTE